MKIDIFFHVPGYSGIFRDVPECSGMFHVPGLRIERTVNSRYCGHSRTAICCPYYRESVIAGCEKKKILENKFTGRRLLVFTFILTAVRLTRAVFARSKSIVITDLQTEQYSAKQNSQKPL